MITVLIIGFIAIAVFVAYFVTSKKKEKLEEEKFLSQLAPDKIEPIVFVQEELVVKQNKKPVKKAAKKKVEAKPKIVKKSVKKTTKK
jgi:hypothetical protein